MYVCMYVCMCVCMYVCMYVYVYVYVYVKYMYTYVHVYNVCICIDIDIYIYKFNHIHMYQPCSKVVSDSYHFLSPQNLKFLRSRQDLRTLAPARALAMLAMTSGSRKQKRKHWKLYTGLLSYFWTKLGCDELLNMFEVVHCCSDQMLKTSIF